MFYNIFPFILVCLLIFKYCDAACPGGWVTEPLYPGICYNMNDPLQTLTWENGRGYCMNKTSDLPQFHTISELLSFITLLQTYFPTGCSINSYWALGLQYNSSINDWTTLDGYNNVVNDRWGLHHPNTTFGDVGALSGAGRLYLIVNSSTFALSVLCQIRQNATPSGTELQPFVSQSSRCPDLYNWYYDSAYDICYRDSWLGDTWYNNDAYCKSMGPGVTLPIFCNVSELASYSALLSRISAYCDRRWVGISDMSLSGTFVDSFGLPPTYLPIDPTVQFVHPCDGSTFCFDSSPWTSASITYYPHLCIQNFQSFCQFRPGNNCSSTSPPVSVFCNYTSTAAPTTTTTDSTTKMSSYITTPFIDQSSTSFYPTTELSTTNVYAIPLLEQLNINIESMSNSASQSATIQDASPFLVQSLNDSMKQMLGYQLRDMISSCSFKNIPCDMANDFEEFYNPALGNCFTFNPGTKPKYWTKQAGSPYGLKLVLSASQAEYMCSASVAGFRVNVHENNIRPFPDAEGYNIPLGILTSMSIFEDSLNRLGAPYTTCADTSFKQFLNNYTVEACQRSCFQANLMKSCNCADPRYPLPNDATFCGPEKKDCLDYAKNCESDQENSCDCPPPCNEILYYPTMTFAYMNVNDVLETITCTNDYCNETLKTDYAMLSVYYQQMMSVINVEAPAYGIYQIYNDLCSLTGLLFGIGAITILEVFFLFATIISHIATLFVKKLKH